MKKTLMTIAIMTLATFSYAQGGQGGQEKPKAPSAEEMIKRATTELSLTDAQIKQWQEIHKKYGKPSDDKVKADETRKAMGKELEATLTTEQLEKFKKMRENQRPPRPNGEK